MTIHPSEARAQVVRELIQTIYDDPSLSEPTALRILERVKVQLDAYIEDLAKITALQNK